MSSPPPPSSSSPPNDFTSVYVKAWGSFTLPCPLRAHESAYWEFRTEAHDIAFGVEFNAGESTAPMTVLPNNRIAKPDQILQHGSYQATTDGTLVLHWDNTYSKLRGKNLLYRVTVTTPDQNLHAIPFGEIRLTPYGPAVIEGLREEDGIYIVSLPFGSGYFSSATLLASEAMGEPRSINQRCIIGVNMFFNNRVWEAESFFRKDVEKFPIFSLAYGSLGFLRALMTWDKSDIAEANARLKQTRHFVSALLPTVSAMKSVGRFLSRSSGPTLSKAELECTLLQAEAYLLQAMLLFTDESYMSFIKAGLKIRSAWKLYQKCDGQVSSYDDATRASLDSSVVGGIKFGIGCFNVIISILPSIILRVVSALGFPSDRAYGLRLLTECSHSTGVRQPLAYLMLLFVHIVIPAFFTVRSKYHIDIATETLTRAYQQYPAGALFLWMDGRLKRMGRDLPRAISCFTRSARGQPDWLQLQHLCAYELGWCNFFSLEFGESATHWLRLEKENAWSPALFVYMAAVCAMSQEHGITRADGEAESEYEKRLWTAQHNASMPLYSRIEALITRKFGGKPLAVEAFVASRATRLVKDGRRAVLPALELIYLFYGFIQMSDPLLTRALSIVDRVLAGAGSTRPDGGAPLTSEEIALAKLVRAAILKALRRWNEAKVLLIELNAKKDSEFTQEKYVLPFARFELGALLMEQVVEKDAAVESGSGSSSLDFALPTLASDGFTTSPGAAAAPPSAAWDADRLRVLSDAHSILRKCESNSSDYPFKNRLHLRIHLASVEITMLRKNWQEIQGNVQSDEDLKGADHTKGKEEMDGSEEEDNEDEERKQ